jgi:hypothetical protein
MSNNTECWIAKTVAVVATVVAVVAVATTDDTTIVIPD